MLRNLKWENLMWQCNDFYFLSAERLSKHHVVLVFSMSFMQWYKVSDDANGKLRFSWEKLWDNFENWKASATDTLFWSVVAESFKKNFFRSEKIDTLRVNAREIAFPCPKIHSIFTYSTLQKLRVLLSLCLYAIQSFLMLRT